MEAKTLDGRRRDAQITTHYVVCPAHALLGKTHRLECDAGLPIEHLTHLGKDQTARGAKQQASAKTFLEAGKTSAHGGSRNAQFGRGARKGFGLDSLGEGDEFGCFYWLAHMDQIIASDAIFWRIDASVSQTQDGVRVTLTSALGIRLGA